ncbi:hypothetical protein DICSQDRAFT_174870 [Dichomitus squalens LYAD-421 SS1]|uniref:Protein kinase domain-containing protein n=1 Tax=Dichomitus squalens (strain LYAD-421) TaxID=732165 RepID=R7SNA3_DICSQ|nr:uncharacterized protein DICSQDRAFT_174870 [Dichomitus squalens LYAD-421 SS1]EJF56487.1 hypothetical protein DICSQDRAFT_174870 [Dichomitus squalens LYAD-421 SS1]
MSSIEHPSVPRTPPPEEVEVNHEGRGQSETAGSYDRLEANNSDVDVNFIAIHLRSPPTFHATKTMLKKIKDIRSAGTIEKNMYKPLASLLTSMSKALYKTLATDVQENLRQRHRVPAGKSGHMSFINHSSSAPLHFPSDVLCHVKDAPDLLGVYNVGDFRADADGIYKGVPHHRVEAIVEAKPIAKSGGRRQATTYAYRHHQARPDHPAFYCLVVKPQWYQVLLSDPTGVVASPETPWDHDDLRLLAAYIYSHYDPPRGHFLWDDTIAWVPGATLDHPPTWKVKVQDQWYTQGQFIFIGRTTILRVSDADGGEIVIKEVYRHHKRRFKEEVILAHVHGDGDVLGVVRLQGAEHVTTNNETIECAASGEETKRTKERFALLDSGSRLLDARTVNDLLEAVYDALEVHRTVLLERKVLHRDMSLYNILMYPKWGRVSGRPVSEKTPVSIQDVLRGSKRPAEERFPTCLVIDYDNAAKLDSKSGELNDRTGTPLFIARSVSLGRLITATDSLRGTPMPRLTDDALNLYIAVHGRERYDRYNDQPGAPECHGGRPPTTNPDDIDEVPNLAAFVHRPEHDVESVYWTMVYALLRAQPVTAPREDYANPDSADVWKILLSHHIPDREYAEETRESIINGRRPKWLRLFWPDMHDVAVLMSRISQHVRSEYALWEGRLERDHLHEAVQRLILQYLVEHRDTPIELDPERPRPTEPLSAHQGSTPIPTRLSGTQATGVAGHTRGRVGAGRGSAASRNRGRGKGSRHAANRKGSTHNTAAVGGPSQLSAQSREQVTANQPAATDANAKRKSDTKPSRFSKRLKALSGAPVPPAGQRDDGDIDEL